MTILESNDVDTKLNGIADNVLQILSESIDLLPSGKLLFKASLLEVMKSEFEKHKSVEIQVNGNIACELIIKASKKVGVKFPKIDGSYEAVLFSNGLVFFNNKTSIKLDS
ncbi:MAG TPA: hypothetical protein DCL21_05125 [Alphaproteobacteria bacterium]|nr:hypothetical protein [Alphaproteobacteria bacterium]